MVLMMHSATLRMVDLAGSERVGKTKSSGDRLNEAKLINRSLSALGNVIAGLAKNKPIHIPYRDSKLTRLLKGVLEGNCNTTMIATISPCADSYHESISTLLFAQRCMRVETHAIVNEKENNACKLLLKSQLERELQSLKEEIQRNKQKCESQKSLLQHLNNNLTNDQTVKLYI